MIRKQLLPGKWHYVILYLKSEFQLIHQNWTYQLLMTLGCPQDWWPACNYHLGYINSGAKSALEKRVVNFHTNARIFFREIRTKLFTSYTRNLLQKAKLIDNHTYDSFKRYSSNPWRLVSQAAANPVHHLAHSWYLRTETCRVTQRKGSKKSKRVTTKHRKPWDEEKSQSAD